MNGRVIAIVALCAGVAHAATPTAPVPAPLSPAPWTAYVGAQDGGAAWAGFQRGAGKPVRDADRDGDWRPVAQLLKRLPGNADIIVPVGGIGSGKRGEQGSASRDVVAPIALLANSGSTHRLYWQIGNEINSRFMRHALLGEAADASASETAPPSRMRGMPHARGRRAGAAFDDPAVIPAYAEQVFAPAVAAIEHAQPRASQSIVLGTVANAYRPSSIDWLESLLAYRYNAPSPLAGSRVADHVAVVAIHYAASMDEPRWETIFDRLDHDWRLAGAAHGGVRGIWATEEIGKHRAERGEGAATAVRVTLSYLDRAARMQLTPEQLRWSLYAWRRGAPGTTGDDGMRLLMSVLGAGRVADRIGDVAMVGDEGLAAQAFSPTDAPQRLALAVFNRGAAVARLQSLRLPADASPELSVLLLDAQGQHAIPVQRDQQALHFAPALALQRGQTLLIRSGAGAVPPASQPDNQADDDAAPADDNGDAAP